MPDSSKHQIMQKITSLSAGDNHLGELLSYCIGRLCLKSAKSSNDWRKELNSIDVPHIVDWLKAAIINDDAWLNNVDGQNRPKKLMKFGSFEDIQKEADKAMLLANQQNHDIKLIEGDEELYMELEDGFHLVKILTPAALDREGAQMQHCIGGGAYDKSLNRNGHYFLSLRDRFGKPHATLEVKGDDLKQLQGKQNKPPHIKYTKTLKPFFFQEGLQINIPIKNLGYIVCSQGDIHDINNLPDGIEISGSLDLREVQIEILPSDLKIGKSLHLSGSCVKNLPIGLQIGGSLNLRNTHIQSLPHDIKISKSLYIEGSCMRDLPPDIKINKGLYLEETSVKLLPSALKLGGNLYLIRNSIKSLPDGLKVGGHLWVREESVKFLPKNLEVGGSLDITGSSIKSLPDGLIVGGDLDLRGTFIKSLPEGLIVGGDLDLRETFIKSLPEEINVGGEVHGLQK